MARRYANFAASSLTVAVGIGDTTIQVSDASSFPVLGIGDTFIAVLQDFATGDAEIVEVTGLSGLTFTVTRAREGTVAQGFSDLSTTVFQHRLTAGAIELFAAGGGDLVPSYLETGSGIPATLGTAGQALIVNGAATALEWGTIGSAIATPEQFGAIGNGIANDTAAVNSAIATGGVVLLEQTYMCTNVTVGVANTRLIGRGTIRRVASTAGVLCTVSAQNVHWDGPQLDGNRASQSAVTDVLLVTAAKFRMTAGEVYGSKRYGIYATENGLTQLTIASRNVLVRDCDSTPIRAEKTSGDPPFELFDVTVKDVLVDQSAASPSVLAAPGIELRVPVDGYISRLNVSGNTVLMPENPTSALCVGVYLEYATEATVDFNNVEGGAYGLRSNFVAGSANGNRFTNYKLAGLLSENVAITECGTKGVTSIANAVLVEYTNCSRFRCGRAELEVVAGVVQGLYKFTSCAHFSCESPVDTNSYTGSVPPIHMILCEQWTIDDPFIDTNTMTSGRPGVLLERSFKGAITGGRIRGHDGAVEMRSTVGGDVLGQVSITGTDLSDTTFSGSPIRFTLSGGAVGNVYTRITGCYGLLRTGTLSCDWRDVLSDIIDCTRGSTPEGAVTAGVGSTCINTANGTVFMKTSGSGNTGWVALGGGGGDFVPTYLETGSGIPASLGTAMQLLRVNAGATALEFSYGLPASLGTAGQVARVNSGATALEYGYGLPLTIGTARQMLQVNAGGTALEYIARPFDFSLGFGGTYTASQEVARVTLTRAMTLPINLTGSSGSCRVAPTVSSVTFDLKKNGTTFGTAVFAVAATTCTFTAGSATSFAAGDVLTMVAPAGTNAAFADCGVTLQGVHS